MIELQDYTMTIYVKDGRYKDGERLFKHYDYIQKHDQWMQEEVRDLQSGLYPQTKYRITFNPTYVWVKNLMSGKPVKILYRDRGGPCDPSMERYWSM